MLGGRSESARVRKGRVAERLRGSMEGRRSTDNPTLSYPTSLSVLQPQLPQYRTHSEFCTPALLHILYLLSFSQSALNANHGSADTPHPACLSRFWPHGPSPPATTSGLDSPMGQYVSAAAPNPQSSPSISASPEAMLTSDPARENTIVRPAHGLRKPDDVIEAV